jgi:hypothetical protein
MAKGFETIGVCGFGVKLPENPYKSKASVRCAWGVLIFN